MAWSRAERSLLRRVDRQASLIGLQDLCEFPELVQCAQVLRPWLVSESLWPVGPRNLADIVAATIEGAADDLCSQRALPSMTPSRKNTNNSHNAWSYKLTNTG